MHVGREGKHKQCKAAALAGKPSGAASSSVRFRSPWRDLKIRMGTRPGASPGISSQCGAAPLLSTCFHAQPQRSQQCLRDTHSPEGAACERPDSTVLPLFTREPQTIIVLGPKASAHPLAALP